MRIKKGLSLRNLIFLCSMYMINNFVIANADTRSLLGTYENWDAFELVTDAGEKVCYAISVPQLSGYKKQSQSFVTVTHKPSQNIKNEFQFRVGYDFQNGSKVGLIHNRERIINFFTNGKAAWGADNRVDNETVDWFLKNEGFSLSSTDNNGIYIFHKFSLDGFIDAYAAINSACVNVTKKDDSPPPIDPPQYQETKDNKLITASSGSGFAVSRDGYVITNNHVINQCQNVVIHFEGQAIPATVVTYDTKNDLALLKADFKPQTVFPLSINRPELLQDVYVAGYPFGVQISSAIKVTKGIISSLTGYGNNFSHIQIDAALQSGNSGGPILDDLGNVVGVAVAKLDAKFMYENYGSIPENINFGIKANVVKSILDSNNVAYPKSNAIDIEKSELARMITNGTYYLSCWMTMAQIKEMRTKKVLFESLN